MSTLRQLLETHGRTVALAVALELGCGLADTARIQRIADAVLADLAARRHARGGAGLDAELVESVE